jgi:hypothetical protein
MFFGSRNPQMRSMRLVLLVVLLVAGAAFHHTGATYTAIRVVYYAVILGALGFAFALWRRSVSKHQAPPGAPTTTVPGAPGPLPPPGEASTALLQPGWYPDQYDMALQRYWTGSAWTTTRHWDGSVWVKGRVEAG